MFAGVVRRVALPLGLIVALMALAPAAVGLATAVYVAPAHSFSIPPGANHDIYTWQGVKLQSPDSSGSVASATSPATCDPSGAASCEDIKLTVPALAPATLYVKIAWTHPVWKAYMYVTSPGGTRTYGGPLGCDTDSFDKGCGNETSLPVDEVTIPAPAAGVWTVRVAAVNIHDEAYQGFASLVNANPFQYQTEKLRALTQHLTKTQRVNIAFVGWKPDATVLQDLVANLPNEYVPSSASKQSPDGDDSRDSPASGLVQHETAHYTGTDPNNPSVLPGLANFVPYFQPMKFKFQYRFLAADDTYTKDLFGAMKAATHRDQDLLPDGVYATSVQNVPSHEQKYLEAYNARYGVTRPEHPATCTSADCKVDMIDAFQVEDWIQGSRLDPRYCASFTDLRTGAKTGAQFLNPDPSAVRDPYWDGNGTRAVNVDVQPQGTSQDISFMYLDTYFPSYANQYFNLSRYHTLASFNHITDPDTGGGDEVDNARGWGGRFRFYFQDMGAAPSFYERENWLREEVDANSGSSAFDPPIWQYRNDPTWNGSTPPGPQDNPDLRAAGNTVGQVLGWDVNQGFAFKYIGSYLYRPIPSDVYILATNSWIDFYSQPAQGGFYKIDFTKVYKPALGLKALNSASPYATFTDSLPELPNLSRPNYLGCANNHHTLNTSLPQPFRETPGVQGCAAGTPENPVQHAIEQGKNNGALGTTVDGTSIPDAGVDANALRNFVDHNRPTYAPLKTGVFTVPVLNIYFEKLYNVAIPLIVGGLAEGTNDGEGWGQIDNLNERSVTKTAIDCAGSLPGAPACLPGGGPFSNARAMTYIVQHEAAHFQGLHHPHDGTASVERASTLDGPPGSPFSGPWHYYYAMNKWQYDLTASPTTYGHTYGTYEVVDQDRLMYGHVSEYIKQAQDWIADGYFNEAANGATTASATLRQREATMKADRDYSASLFQVGDYLHSQFAMRNAVLHAKGFFFPAVAPHRLSLDETQKAAAFPACTGTSIGCSRPGEVANGNFIFKINPQPVYSSDVCGAGVVVPQAGPPGSPVVSTPAESGLPNTAAGLSALAGMLGNSGAWSALGGVLLLLGGALLGLGLARRGAGR
jgi:hypothetical protein